MPDDFIRRSDAMNKINDIAAEFLKDHTIQCDIAAGVAVDIKNDVIKTLPAADVVEVVRCNACKNYELMTSNNQHFCSKYGGYVNGNDYCSRCEKINPSAST